MFRKLLKLLTQRAAITVLSFLLQIALIVVGVLYAAALAWWAWLVCEFVSFLICLYIVSRDINPAYKLSWCIIILLAPAFGWLIYLFIGRQHTPRRVRKRLSRASDVSQVLLNRTNGALISERGVANPTGTTCADLVLNSGSYPVYGGTTTTYYS
ncbi:MAG: PLD nuclease N-terminal domain-containing protein, partial [Clostridiales bacterium]|nr:PLD nuclease N-terminal domain-containing protein [Clostridiales bacterium]